MKRSFLALALSSLISIFASAKDEVKPDTRPIFGVKAGFDINIPSDWHTSSGHIDMYEHGYGVTLGAVCNIYLGKSFYLEPGVSLFYDQYVYKDVVLAQGHGELITADPKVNKYGVRVPIVAGFAFAVNDQFSFSLFTGPEFNYVFSGKYSLPKKYADYEFPSDPFESERRFDCAWKIGVTVPLSYFHIGIDTALGITDLMKSPGISFRENRVTVSVTYYFN